MINNTEGKGNENTTYKFATIMVVDDSLPDRFIAEKLICRANIAEKVIIKESAIDALAFLTDSGNKDKMPQVIFLDIRMPEMDGFEFLEQFKKLPSNTVAACHIYMLTSSSYADDKSRAQSFSFVKGFISKPLTETVLLKHINA